MRGLTPRQLEILKTPEAFELFESDLPDVYELLSRELVSTRIVPIQPGLDVQVFVTTHLGHLIADAVLGRVPT